MKGYVTRQDPSGRIYLVDRYTGAPFQHRGSGFVNTDIKNNVDLPKPGDASHEIVDKLKKMNMSDSKLKSLINDAKSKRQSKPINGSGIQIL